MTGHKRPEDMIEHIQRDFQLGGHKAAAIAKVMGMADIYLVSELAPSFAASMFFKPYHSAQEALADALDEKGADASVLVMGHGGSVLPFAKRR